MPYLTANVHFMVSSETNALLVANAALRWSPSSLAQIAPEARSQIQNGTTGKDAKGIIWVKEGEYVRPMEVKVGTSDGSSTAVAADNLQEGAEVVTGETTENSQVVAKVHSCRKS